MSESQQDLPTRIRGAVSRALGRIRVVSSSSERQPSRVRIIEQQRFPLVDPLENVRAADNFVKTMRDPQKYIQHSTTSVGREIGFIVDNPLEKGFFDAQTVLNIAEHRYDLPMAMYISGRHARLVLNAPYFSLREKTWKMQVYDPMDGGITEVKKQTEIRRGVDVLLNSLAYEQLEAGRV